MTVNNVGTMTEKPTTTIMKHENLGTINLMWATKTGLSQIKTATVMLKDGSTTVVDVQVDATTDILAVPVSSPAKEVLLWDIQTIDLK